MTHLGKFSKKRMKIESTMGGGLGSSPLFSIFFTFNEHPNTCRLIGITDVFEFGREITIVGSLK